MRKTRTAIKTKNKRRFKSLRPLPASGLLAALPLDMVLRPFYAYSTFPPSASMAAFAPLVIGIPRTVNILCDTALVYGFAVEARSITKEIVIEVLAHKKTLGVFAQ